MMLREKASCKVNAREGRFPMINASRGEHRVVVFNIGDALFDDKQSCKRRIEPWQFAGLI